MTVQQLLIAPPSTGQNTPPLPAKTYQVIYADPPWSYGSRGARGGKFGKLDYSSMPTADICDLPVSQITDRNAALFLWATGSLMPDALAVIAAWGFSFTRIDKVWAKKTSGGKPHAAVGPWGMSDAEFLLLAVRGSMASKQAETQYVITEAAYPGKHSRKPALFREQIDRRFPQAQGARIELFARDAAKGWDCWGNEAPKEAA